METKSYSIPPGPDLAEGSELQLPIIDRDHYQRGAEIARGGMGRVVEAYDLRLGRNVALKELLPDHEHHVVRFEHEARITARLQHPNIIHVYEAGRWIDGLPFYAMTRVIGRSLDKVIAERTTLTERLGLVSNVIATADALAYAHSQGVIHRDLKPANVLVGEFGETVVIDWGLAKTFEHDSPAGLDTDSGQTVSGSVVGTPGYMAPEQARADAQIDARADVYSIGTMLYEVLVGAPPYGRASSHEILQRVLEGPPIAVRLREPGVPVDLAAIVDKAMARARNDRYANAGELVADLKRFETGQLVAARHYSTAERVARFVRRRALILGAVLVLLIVAIASVVRIAASRDDAIAARAETSVRNNALVLLQARAELTRDPTATLAWLATYPDSAPGWDEVKALATDAWSRGVARDVWDLGSPLSEVAFGPDSKTLAIGATDGTLTMIDIESRAREVVHLPDSSGSRMIFSPDGMYLATTDGHESVRLWDRRSHTSIRLAGDHTGGATMEFSPDGSLLLVRHLGGDYRFRLWRIPSGEPVPLPFDATGLAFMPGSRRMAIWKGPEISLVDPDANLVVARTTIQREPSELVVSGDGTLVAVALGEALLVWNPTTNTTRTIHTGEGVVTLLAASRDGKHVVSCGMLVRDQWLFDLVTGEGRKLSSDEGCTRQAAGYSPNSLVYVTNGLGGELRLHLLPGGQTRMLLGHQGTITGAAFSPDGRYLASASSDHTLRLWAWSSGDIRVLADSYSPDRMSTTGRLLVTEARRELSVVDVKTGQRSKIESVPAHVVDTVLSSNGRVLGSLTAEGAVVRHDLDTGEIQTIPFSDLWTKGGITFTNLSVDGNRLAQLDPVGVLRVFDLANRSTRELARFGDASFSMVFSDDSKLLAASSRDGSLRIFGGEHELAFQLQTMIWGLAFSGDDRFLGVACNDGVVRVIDLATRRVRELRGHVGGVGGVDLNHDGTEVVSAGADGTVRRWDSSDHGEVIHREPFPITSIQRLPGTSLLVERGLDALVFRIWDTSVLPPSTADKPALRAWIAHTTSATVEPSGAIASH